MEDHAKYLLKKHKVGRRAEASSWNVWQCIRFEWKGTVAQAEQSLSSRKGLKKDSGTRNNKEKSPTIAAAVFLSWIPVFWS